ncbi:hypothetical protein ACJX0J_018331, partial [Zea mays]
IYQKLPQKKIHAREKIILLVVFIQLVPFLEAAKLHHMDFKNGKFIFLMWYIHRDRTKGIFLRNLGSKNQYEIDRIRIKYNILKEYRDRTLKNLGIDQYKKPHALDYMILSFHIHTCRWIYIYYISFVKFETKTSRKGQRGLTFGAFM